MEPCAKDKAEKYMQDKFEDAETIKAVTALRDLVSGC